MCLFIEIMLRLKGRETTVNENSEKDKSKNKDKNFRKNKKNQELSHDSIARLK